MDLDKELAKIKVPKSFREPQQTSMERQSLVGH